MGGTHSIGEAPIRGPAPLLVERTAGCPVTNDRPGIYELVDECHNVTAFARSSSGFLALGLGQTYSSSSNPHIHLSKKERPMHLPARYVVDTALSIEDNYYNSDDLPPEPRELVEEVKALVGEFSFDTLTRGTPMIKRVPEDEMGLVKELDDLLYELRDNATELFDVPREQAKFSAEWWIYTGTLLETCDTTEARTVIELQDLKYQAPDAFHENVAELNRFEGLCVLLLFGNEATTSDLEPVDFGSFMGLEVLDLAENKLGALPAGTYQLPNLRELNLSDNINMHLDTDLAADWETPNLERLDIRETFYTDEFVETMGERYPNLRLVT